MKNKFKARKSYATGVQSIPARPTSGYDEGQASMGVASTTMSGFASGGVPGALIGAFTGLVKRDKDKRAAAELLDDQNHAWKSGLITQAQGNVLTASEDPEQRAQIKDGIDGASAEPVEVEKDELVFSKSPTGKYILKADFKGGKTHNEGGEDYEPDEGDVIFPGKDRKKVMRAYSDQNYPRLETMRMKLPKTSEGLAEDGLDKTDPKKELAQLQLKGNLQGYTPEEEARVAFLSSQIQGEADNNMDIYKGKMLNQADPYGYEQKAANPVKELVDGGYSRQYLDHNQDDVQNRAMNQEIDSWKQQLDARNGIHAFDTRLYRGGAIGGGLGKNQSATATPSTITPKESVIPEVAVPGGKTGKGVNPNAHMPSSKMISSMVPTRVGLDEMAPMSTFKPGAIDLNRIQAPAAVETGGGVTTGGGGKMAGAMQGAGYAAQGLAALTNLFPGKAEVQSTPKIQLDRLNYQDTSAGLRQASNINERVQASNARNISGGNVQNYMANRRQAGLENLQTQQGINSEEYRRSIGVANENIRIGGRQTMFNSQLGIQDEQVNAANRGARRNIQSAGIGQLGELGATIGRDRTANMNQAELRKAISSGMYQIGPDGTIEIKS